MDVTSFAGRVPLGCSVPQPSPGGRISAHRTVSPVLRLALGRAVLAAAVHVPTVVTAGVGFDPLIGGGGVAQVPQQGGQSLHFRAAELLADTLERPFAQS